MTFVTFPSAIIVHGPPSIDASAWYVKNVGDNLHLGVPELSAEHRERIAELIEAIIAKAAARSG